MVIKLFGLKITVEKDIPFKLINEGGGLITVHMDYEVAKKHFLKKLHGSYSSVVNDFRASVKDYFGYSMNLTTTIVYVKRYFMEGDNE